MKLIPVTNDRVTFKFAAIASGFLCFLIGLIFGLTLKYGTQVPQREINSPCGSVANHSGIFKQFIELQQICQILNIAVSKAIKNEDLIDGQLKTSNSKRSQISSVVFVEAFGNSFQRGIETRNLKTSVEGSEKYNASLNERLKFCMKCLSECRTLETLHWQAVQHNRQHNLFPHVTEEFPLWRNDATIGQQSNSSRFVTETGETDIIHVIQPLSWRPVIGWKEETMKLKKQLVNCKASFQADCHSSIPSSMTSKTTAKPKSAIFPAPVADWKQDMDYKDTVTISFLMQYFRQPTVAPAIIDRLYNCTAAFRSLNITTELIVHVDEASAVDMWQELYNRTREGHFLTLMFSHNLAEVRGYNRMAQIARGRVIMMLQDDEHPPENCAWLPKVLKLFEMFPRTGIVGMRGSNLAAGGEMGRGRLGFEQLAEEKLTKIGMHFASLVDSSPMLYRRRAYWYLGGQDEAMMGGKGESGIMTDWDMALRAWLAGFYVAHITLDWTSEFRGVSVGGTHFGIGGFTRGLNSFLNPWLVDEHGLIFEEVKRVNMFLRNIDPSSF